VVLKIEKSIKLYTEMTKKKDKAQEEELKNEQETPVTEETQETAETTEGEVKEEEVVEKTPEELEAERIQAIETNLAEMTDKYARLSAEFDNYRKRTMKEKMDLMKTAGEKIFMNILPVMDNFERAMTAMKTAQEIKPVIEGVGIIYARFAEFLKQSGLEAIDTEKAVFDVELHEAITKIPAPSKKMKGKIIDCVEKGYKLNDKVVRYAKVVVGE
jgi:molecular chaperone GrpE